MDQDPNKQNQTQGKEPRVGFRSYETDIEAARSHKPVGPVIPTHLEPEKTLKDEIDKINEKDAPQAPVGPMAVPYVQRFDSGLKTSGVTYKTYEASTAEPEPIPKENPQIAVNALHKEETTAPTFHSMASDANTAVKTENASVIKIAIAEQERKLEHPNRVEDPKKSIFALSLGGLLLLGGFISLGTYLYFKGNPAPTPIPTLAANQIMSVDAEKRINIKADENPLKTVVSSSAEFSSGKVVRVTLTDSDQIISSTRFLELLNTQAPTWFERSLKGIYMTGLYRGQTTNPFMIFTVDSYDNAFSGMLKWESTMTEDLAPMLPENFQATVGTNFTDSPFTDGVIKNKDVRMIKDSSGKPVLIYAFPSKNLLIITTSREAIEEVFARLTTSTFVR